MRGREAQDALKEKTLVVIPALNEAANIGSVVRAALSAAPGIRVLVVDDGSSDDTAALARQSGARVLRLPFNLGIGAAVQAGFLFAIENGYEWAIRLDSDGQHNPADIPRFLEMMAENPSDLLVGSRFLEPFGFRSSVCRRMGISFFNRIISFLTGFRVSDTTSGYLAFSSSAMRRLALFMPDDYPEPETIVMMYKWKLTVGEIPVVMEARKAGVSSIRYLWTLYYMVKVTLAVMLDMVRYR